MRFEGLIWFIIGGLIFFLSLDVLIWSDYGMFNPFPYLLCALAFFSMGIGIVLITNEIIKSVSSSD